MKKLKSILALMIAMVIMCISVNPAFSATDAEWELYLKMYDLFELCEEAHFAYGVGYSIIEEVETGSPTRPKYLDCSDTTELKKAWEEACPMVEGYFDPYMNPYGGEISIVTATEKYNTLHEELYKIVIDRSELEFLVAFCEQERNDDGYYEAQLWENFQTEITQSKELLADESITDMRVNTAYYELMYQLNLLCTCNKVPEDVDFDGKMSVLDATYVQLYLAEYKFINSSQLVITSNYHTVNIDILDATDIQKKCAKLIDVDGIMLENLIYNLENSNPDSEEFELSCWRKNPIFYYAYRTQ